MRYLPAPGLPTAAGGLSHRISREILAFLPQAKKDANLVECRRDGDQDVLVLDLRVPELPQKPKNEIQRLERIAIIPRPAFYPKVLALRDDFPLVPHLNLEADEFPRSLCLFEEPWDEVKRWLTGPLLLRRLQEWLRLTARGEQHQPDQPLERFFYSSEGVLIVPPELIRTGGNERVAIMPMHVANDRIAMRAVQLEKGQTAKTLGYILIQADCPAVEHGIIRRQPKSIGDLHRILQDSDYNLVGLIHSRIQESFRGLPQPPTASSLTLLRPALVERENLLRLHKDHLKAWLNSKLVILVRVPMKRHAEGETEAVEPWAFLTLKYVKDFVESMEILYRDPNGTYTCIGYLSKRASPGDDVEIGVLNVVPELTRSDAATQNDLPDPSDTRIVLIGGGALGSQVLANLCRAGWGKWTIIDSDILLPHNIARHALGRAYVGCSKVDALLSEIGNLTTDAEVQGLCADVTCPRSSEREGVAKALSQADIILDCSATASVGRFLSDDNSGSTRRVSLFLNPKGTDLVLLSEGSGRQPRLTDLEAQYYRAVAFQDDLHGHMEDSGERIRRGRSCRDVTSRLPQHLVALHAAIGSKAIRESQEHERKAMIRLWRANPKDMSVQPVDVKPFPVRAFGLGEWKVFLDGHLEQQLDQLRRKDLPNETGGILIGMTDVERRTIHIVAGLPVPADSDCYPCCFIRGSKGLRTEWERIRTVTQNELDYVGEWHSHPDGATIAPSSDDKKVMKWVREHMGAEGGPGLVLIAGEKAFALYLGADGNLRCKVPWQ